MFILVLVAALVAVTTADSGGGAELYSDGISRTRLSQQCAGVCKDSAKFNLQPGWTYVYKYEGTTTSEVAGSSNETSQIKISAKAHVRVSARPCELILVVRDVQLLDSDGEGLSPAAGQKEFAAELEQFPLKFSYQDGRVEQLCPSADESTWALNIKRGLLSVFQNSISDLSKDGHMYEKDVSGSCETTYTVSPTIWSDVKVLKFKNLQNCGGRGHHTLGLPASWTHGARSTPIIKSDQICEQTIMTDNGTYLANSRCQETHVFAPFSNGQSGIRTVAEVNLELDSITQSEDDIPVDLFVNKRTNLLFEYSPEGTEGAVTADEVWATLNQLVNHSQLGVDKDVPQLFNHLVSQLARMDDQQLVKLFDEMRDPRTRGYLLDALPLLGSAGSVWAMYQIYSAGEVTREEVDSWLTALAFHRQPSLEVVDKLGLFLSDGYHPRTWLAAGAVVHSYCKHDPACQQRREVQAILATLEAVLGQSCHSDNREEQQQVIVALKAIGNAGLINSLETLEQCFTKENENPVEVRLAAVAAVRRLPCGLVSRLPLLRMLQNKEEDSELRIAAYLALLQCPSTSVVSRLRDLLHGEDTNQVLSFIWTHLTNIQESSSAWRGDIRQMLQDTYLANKFKTDARKFSRNYETSAYSDILNSGVTADSNIIFSTKSYLPRSANLNLTLDLFGETINVFEIGTRIEGFESVVENIFGPKGIFPDESMQKMLKNMKESSKEGDGVIQSFSKSFTKGMNNEPHGTVFVRVLGNELYLSQFTGLGDIMKLKNVKKQSLKYIRESLASIFTNRNVDYSKSFRFINTEHVIPTILGIPLKVKVNGTASVSMQLKSDVDLDNILKTSSGEIVFSANPSAAISIDGEMAVDATFAQAGVKTKGSLSSNIYLDTNIKVEKGKVIDLFVNVPRDKVEVINVTSSVFVKRRDGLVEIEGVGEVSEQDTCSGEHIPTLSGLRLCSQYVLRNASAVHESPYFPLTGKSQYALSLQKSDEFQFYQFHLKQDFKVVSDINTHIVRHYSGDLNIEMDTPGSKVNRRIAADLSFDTKNGNARLEVDSPAGSVELTGRLAVDDRQTTGVAELEAKVNGEDYAAVKLGLQTESVARSVKFEPLFVLQIVPQNIDVNISGHFHIVQGSKYSADITAVGFTEQPLLFSGDLSGAKGRYSASLAAKAEAVHIKVNSHIVNTAAVSSCKTLVRYVLPGRAVESVDFSGKLQSQKKGGFTRKQLLVNLQMSQLPQYNTKVGWILYRTKMYIDSNMELTVGKTQWRSQQMYHNNLQARNKNLEAILSLESPSKSLDYKAELQYKTTDNMIHGHALAQLSKSKQFIARADYVDAYPQRILELEVANPWSRVSLEGGLVTTPETQGVNATVAVKWGPADDPRWLSVTGRYHLAETPLSATNVVTGKLEVIDWENPVEFTGLWRARAEGGLILSESGVTVVINKDQYALNVNYVKNPMKGKHDVEVELNLPDNSYTGNFLMINSQEKKNVTVRLDLEKTLYFTTQLQLWKGFDLQLFWNYLEDKSQSVLIQYKNTPKSEIAIISMPGHYASLTVDKLAPGFSSMNITAMWGESEGLATNTILLSTYWNLNVSSVYSPAFGHVLMPVIEAKVHLKTPFVGFEQQSFILDVHGIDESDLDLSKYSVTKKCKVVTNWQEQFIDFDIIHSATFQEHFPTNVNQVTKGLQFLSSLSCSINSSLETFRDVSVMAIMQDNQEFIEGELNHDKKNHILNVSYNKWATLVFDSTYTPAELSVSVDINDKAKEETWFSGKLSVKDGLILVQSSFSPEKKVFFKSTYHWPYNVAANLETSFTGFEQSTFQYNFAMDDETIHTKLTGGLGKEFFTFIANLYKSQSKLNANVDISSSSTLPDLTLEVEHEIYKDQQKSTLKESFALSLHKGGKILQSGQGLLSFIDDQISISSKMKQLETVVVFPGHSSSLNYTHRTQVKTTGVEVLHELNQLWNSEKMDVSLVYEGLKSVVGVVKRNHDKKAEFSFKKVSNTNYKMDLSLNGGYSLKHRLFFIDYPNWENFLAVTSPSTGKVIMKNLQSMNSEGTSFVHKSTISLNKEVAYIDFVYNVDSESNKLNNIMFSSTSPWNHPVIAKYDLLIDTGATSKHELELKFKQGQEIKGVFDVTSSEKKHSAAFTLYSPYCKDLAGNFSFESDTTKSKGILTLNADIKQIMADVELVKTAKNPLLSISLNSSTEKIFNFLSTYDVQNSEKELKIVASYYNKELSFDGHYTFNQESLKMGFIARTPVIGWKEVSLDFDTKLSHKYSKFALNAKMDENFLILSGTGSLLSDLVKVSVSIDYSINKEPKKHSVLFEYNKSKESILVSFNYKTNENSAIDFNITLLKEPESVVNQDSYLFTYKSQTPLEMLPDSDVEMRFIKNDKAQRITGAFNINNLQTTFTGENTFDSSGIGYLDFNIKTPNRMVGLLLKHSSIPEQTDSYIVQLLNNGAMYIDGIVSLSNKNKGLHIRYGLKSSLDILGDIEGTTIVLPGNNSFDFDSSLTVKGDNFSVIYNVNLGQNNGDETKHNLNVLLAIKGYVSKFRGNLEYKHSNSELVYLKGEITDGKSAISNIFYSKTSPSESNIKIDLGEVVKVLAESNRNGLMLSVKVSKTETIPSCLMNLTLSKSLIIFETDNSLMGKIQFNADLSGVKKASFFADFNGLRANGILHMKSESLNLEVMSNIPDWKELKVLFRQSNTDNDENKKYYINISKENQEIFHMTTEGAYNRFQGNGLFSLTMHKFFIDVDLHYEFLSEFSLDLNYNINGNKQHTGGKITFSPDTARLDLATPIKGFEDLTLTSTFNRKNKKAGLVFEKNGKILTAEISATVERQRVVFKGSVTDGKDEFIVSIGAQNGTADEPKSVSFYITAFKNKLSVLMISFDGSYDLQTNAGIKFSFSSHFYKQLYFEISTLKEKVNQSFTFNYIYGIDIAYSLKSTIIKEIYKPKLVIESNFGQHKTHIDIWYNVENPAKEIAVLFNHDDKMLLDILGNVSFVGLDCKFILTMDNKNILSGMKNLNISGGYNFEYESSIDALIFANDVKYFDLSMKSSSLYKTKFQSSLVPSKYIKNSYFICLDYNLALPDLFISSHVLINEEYYNSKANLTWNESVATIFYQLNTNAGYGFENAVMSAHYKCNDGISYSHLVDFTIDNSTLFHIASHISYPNRFSLDIVLPDSLFLPFVKEIRIGFNLTEEEKNILLKYMSGSQEKRKFDLVVFLQEHQCTVQMGRSEIDEEDILQSDSFIFSYKLLNNLLEFETSLIWENNELFTVSFQKEVFSSLNESTNLFEVLFNRGNHHIWKVVFVNKDIFEFSGIINQSEVKVVLTHPKTMYHDQFGLTKLSYTFKIEEFETLKVVYNQDSIVHSKISFNNPVAYVLDLLRYKDSYGTFATFELIHKDGVLNINEEQICEGAMFIGSRIVCDSLFYKVYQTGTSHPLSLQIKLNLIASELNGILTRGNKHFSFGGKAKINESSPMCSNGQVYFNSSDNPSAPFALRYETNCFNSVIAAVNIFEKDTRAVNAVFDFMQQNKNFYIQGNNIYYNDWNVSAVLNNNHGKTGNVSINIEENNIEASFLVHPEKGILFKVETTFKELNKIEIIYGEEIAYEDIIIEKYIGKLKIQGSKTNTEWKYEYLNLSDGTLMCTITSDNELVINLAFENSNEFSVKVSKGNKLYEGKGWIKNSTHTRQGNAMLSLDGNKYEFNFEHFTSLEGEVNASVTLDTPVDQYFIKFHIQQSFDLQSSQSVRLMSIKYKTPYYPLDSADIKVKYSVIPVMTQEVISIKEFALTEDRKEEYKVSYSEIIFSLSLKTKHISIDDAVFSLSFGNKYSLHLKLDSMKVTLETLLLTNLGSLASQTTIDIEGIDVPYLNLIEGKTLLKVYFDSMHDDALAFLKTPSIENVLITFQKFTSENGYYEDYNFSSESNRTIQVVIGKETVLNLASYVNMNKTSSNDEVESNKYIRFLLDSQWQSKRIVKYYLDATLTNNEMLNMHFDVDSKVVQFQSLFSNIKTDMVLIKSLAFNVSKSFVGEAFHPEVVFKRAATKDSEIEYNLNFTNGFSNEMYLSSGRCSLKLPDLSSFSIDSKPSMVADIFLESNSAQYASIFNIHFQRNKLDASINWRRSIKPIKKNEALQFTSLLFGGQIQKNNAEFYLNENRFVGSIESTKTLTSINVNLVNSKLNKNITVFASVQYIPIFLMTVSHTVFDSPCSIEVKVDRKSKSIESAVIVVYNNLKQQAYVNVYLDSRPRYVELIYIDIWQQTHEVSGQIEERDDEVTVKGKINSPALDENFLIITIGSNNDKFDLNLSDMLIFKAFKDDESLILNLLIFGNDYILKYKNRDRINELTVESPVLSGDVIFSLKEILVESFASSEIHFGSYNFLLLVNEEQLFKILLSNETEHILHTAVEFQNGPGVFQLHIQCDILEFTNSLNLKHTSDPILLVLSVGSSYYHQNHLEVMFGIKNEELITGIFEVIHESPLFKTYLVLSKENRSLEMTAEAPLFSEMDKAKINGIFKFFDAGDCEMKLSGAISSAETLMAHVSLHFINSDEVFSTGLVLKSRLNTLNGIEITVDIPLQLSRDMKTNFILQLPHFKSYEFSSSLCIGESKVTSSAVLKWQDLLYSLDYKYGNTPFYDDSYEWNIHYLDRKVQVGAWMKPKHPLTDYIYFFDLDDKRIVQLSHALILKHNHFKSKLIVESAFEGHEKYGVDLELQNLKLAKVVRLLGSVPQVGKDLGLDFAFSYESLLNYAVLAQIRIPYDNQIKTAKLTSLQKIQRHLNLTKLNHTLECDDLGAVGWEFEMYGSAPFFWQGDISSLETKVNTNYDVYSTKIKSYLQPSKVQLSCVFEAPLTNFQKVEVHLSGTKQLVGSEFVLSLNSNELINASISEDQKNNKHITILSKWRNILLTYLYEVYEGELGISGLICWDLNKKETSQLGLSVSGKVLEKYETSVVLILPSALVPKLSAKAVFSSNTNQLFSLLQLQFPGLEVEGKIASDISPEMWKSGMQLKWTPQNRPTKDIGLFYVTEISDDEVKTYFTLQHFALKSDIMLSTFMRNTLYGVHLQYSPAKEEEVTLELGYWTVQDGEKERSGVKFSALHPASNTLIYSLANVTSTDDFLEGGISIGYIGKDDYGKIRYVEIFGKKNRKIPQVFLGFSSNGNTLGVGGSLWKKDNALQGVTVEARVNQNDPFRLEIVQNTVNPGIETELSYSLSRTYRAYVGMPNNNELTARLSHTIYGRPNTDALATLRLNSSRILWGKFEFPPMAQVGQEFYNGVLAEYSDVTSVSQAISEGFLDFVKEDFSEKALLLLNGVSSQSDILVQQTSLELSIVLGGFENFGRNVLRCYEMDYFYLKTGIQHLKKWGIMIQEYSSCVVSAVTETVSNLLAPVIKIASRVWGVVESVLYQWKTFIFDLNVKGGSPLCQLSDVVGRYRNFRHALIEQARHAVTYLRQQLSQLEHRTSQWLTQAELSVNRIVNSAQQMVATQVQRAVDYTQTLLAGFSVLGKAVEEMVEIVREGIYRIREVRHTLEWVSRAIDTVNSWFTNFRLGTYLRQLDMFFDKVIKLITSDVEKNFGEYEVYLIRAQQFLTGQYEELSKIPQVHYIRSVINHVYQKVKWFWNYAKMNERLREAVRKHLENIRGALDDIENRLDHEEGEMRFEYEYNDENNSLTFTQELPFKWQAFNELPEYNMEVGNGGFSIPAQEYSNMVQTVAQYVWQDAKLLPYLLPPLGADALISGRKVVTFDNSYYEMPDTCGRYLLTADLYHESFSLVLDLDKGKRDLLLTTQNIDILVKQNFEVYINGKLEDLPLTLNNGKRITLERKPHSVYISSEEGFSLECNSYQEQCRFHLNGWYTGKVAGLFGTYNNEPLDDFVAPNWLRTKSIQHFVGSWLMGIPSCDSDTSKLAESEEEAPSYESMCELFFASQSSPFYPCFHVVDPKAFYNMCLANARKGNTCSAVFAYLTKCTSSGVQLWMPEFCVSDSYSSEAIDSPIVTTSEMTVDVVFVVEDSDCIRKDTFNFADLPTTINTELRLKGMTDNRFAFISFTRKSAQIQTIDGQIWTEDEQNMANVISRLDTASDLPSAYVPALDLATNLPFRPGASKMAILIHCSSCPVDQSHSGILERLSQQDMSLHILQQDVILGKRGRAVGKAIGLEKSGAYPRKRLGKNTSPSAALLEQVSVPQDLCTPLVLGTNGTLFHMDVLQKGLRAWGSRVAAGTVPPTPVTLCEKTLAADNTPVVKCHWASDHRKLKEWDQTALDEYMDTSKAAEIYTEYEEVDR